MATFWECYLEMDADLRASTEVISTVFEEFQLDHQSAAQKYNVLYLVLESGNIKDWNVKDLETSLNVCSKDLMMILEEEDQSTAGSTAKDHQFVAIIVKVLLRLWCLLPLEKRHAYQDLDLFNYPKTTAGKKTIYFKVISKVLKTEFETVIKLSSTSKESQLEFLGWITMPLVVFNKKLHKTSELNQILNWFQFFFNENTGALTNQNQLGVTRVFWAWKYLIFNFAFDVDYLIRKVDLLLIPIWNYIKYSKTVLMVGNPPESLEDEAFQVVDSLCFLLRALVRAHGMETKTQPISMIIKIIKPFLESGCRVFQANLLHLLVPLFCKTDSLDIMDTGTESLLLQPGHQSNMQLHSFLLTVWNNSSLSSLTTSCLYPSECWSDTEYTIVLSLLKTYISTKDLSDIDSLETKDALWVWKNIITYRNIEWKQLVDSLTISNSMPDFANNDSPAWVSVVDQIHSLLVSKKQKSRVTEAFGNVIRDHFYTPITFPEYLSLDSPFFYLKLLAASIWNSLGLFGVTDPNQQQFIEIDPKQPSPPKPILEPFPRNTVPKRSVSPIPASPLPYRHNQLKEWSQSKLEERLFLTSLVQTSDQQQPSSTSPTRQPFLDIDPVNLNINNKTGSNPPPPPSVKKENAPPSVSALTSPCKPPPSKRHRADLLLNDRPRSAQEMMALPLPFPFQEKDLVALIEQGVGLVDQVETLSRSDLSSLQLNLCKILGAVCAKIRQ